MLFLKTPYFVKARRLEFGYVKSISSVDEKSFPLLIRNVSMKELIIIFPSVIVGLILFLKGEIIYAGIPFMLAFYVLFYNEKSVPFYYQFLAFVEDLFTTGQKGGKKPKERKPSKMINIDYIGYFKKYKKELGQISTTALALSVVLYTIQLELYAEKINFAILIGLSVIAGLLIAFVVVKVTSLVSKR
jgi:hypothetical protein